MLFSDKKMVSVKPANVMVKGSFYDFSLKSLDGKETIDFSKYKGEQLVLKIARNLVDYEAGLTIFNIARGILENSNSKQKSLF
jgi:hypothetical protein